MKERMELVSAKEWEELRRRARLGFWKRVVRGERSQESNEG